MKLAALLYGHEPHHLDHLATLAAILKIPLLVTEADLLNTVKKFYPGTFVIYSDYLSLPSYLVTNYDCIFYTIPRDLFDEIFFLEQKLQNKRISTVWCPHGNSDKGQSTFYMEALKKEEAALVYGDKMIAFLQEKNAFSQLKACIKVGNFRHLFYLYHQHFYDKLVKKEVLRLLPEASRTLLYAPTWQDYENCSSFHEATEFLVRNLPQNWNLILKLHPNLLKKDILKTESICALCEDNPHTLVLSDFPPIYPLLEHIDIYLGDYSSIGYDFLTLNRPLFFCHPKNKEKISGSLFTCGPVITHDAYETLYNTIRSYPETNDPFISKREQLYQQTFHPMPNLKAVEETILAGISDLVDPDLNFF